MPTFPIPEGFQLPEGKRDGETFDAVGTYKIVNGQMIHSAVEGLPIPGYEEEAVEEEVELTPEGGEEAMAEEEEVAAAGSPGERFMQSFNKANRKPVY